MEDFEYLKNVYIAHRGIYNNIDIIENTLEAFSKAIDKKIPIEFDIRMLKDGTLVVFHDKSLKRLAKCDKDVSEFNISNLKTITLCNNRSRIPSFNDVLNLVNGEVLVDIELKDTKHPFKLIKNVINILDLYNGKFIIKSFNPFYMLLIRIYRKAYIRGLLIDKKAVKIPLSLFVSKPNFICCDKDIINNRKIQSYIKRNGCLLYCYNVKDKKEASSLNADGFIIDENIKRY
ncbi:MAG: hypothetical protein J6B89_01905 [Bacilli bacterium]|nr:hypothetical protein [Bacilli bacterium]